MWVRGLKLNYHIKKVMMVFSVALHVSAWIEIIMEVNNYDYLHVALHVSAWIEIMYSLKSC